MTMSGLTRAQKKKTLDHLLTMARLSEDERNYVTSKVIDVEQLVVVNAKGKINDIMDDMTKLSLVPRLMVSEAAEFVEHYVNNKGGYDGLEKISEDDWNRHINRRGLQNIVAPTATAPTQSTNPPVSQPSATNTLNKISVKLSDFPNFSGDMANWGQFHTLFVSAARINRLDEILNIRADHVSRFANDSDYIQKCKDLYNLLDKACAKGDVHAKVHKYDSTQDGYAAWQALTTYYFADGNVKSYTA